MKNSSIGPVFIGGLDGSGKTRLRLMLSCHPNLSMTRRTYMWTKFYNRFGSLDRAANFERCLTAMMRHQPIRKLEPDIERIRRDFWSGTPGYARLFALFHEQYAERVGKPRWGDQLAFIECFADPIFNAFPEARMIHMVRHPRQRFETSDPRRRRRMGRVGWDTARWMFSVRLGLRNRQRYPERYQIVKYEALITRPEETLRKICEFIGEDFLPRLLTLEGAMRFGEEGPENGENARKRSMSKHEVTFLHAWAKKEMHALGYTEELIRFSSKDILRFYAVDGPANAFGAMLWNFLKTDLS